MAGVNRKDGRCCIAFLAQVKVTGDRVDFGEAALIICNHRTRVDWMFLWVLCLRQGQLSGLKIVLKESLKGVPGFGWATQVRPATVTAFFLSVCFSSAGM